MQVLQSYLGKQLFVTGGEGSQLSNSFVPEMYLPFGILIHHVGAKINQKYFPLVPTGIAKKS